MPSPLPSQLTRHAAPAGEKKTDRRAPPPGGRRRVGEAAKTGATILKSAGKVFWGGYSAYFADPDGHPWEVAWDPHWSLGEDGGVTLPVQD